MKNLHYPPIKDLTRVDSSLNGDYCVETTVSDDLLFQDLKSLLNSKEWLNQYPTMEHLAHDLYYSFYQSEPKLKSKSSIHDSAQFNRMFLERLAQKEFYNELKDCCTTNSMYGIMATDIFMKQLFDLAQLDPAFQTMLEQTDNLHYIEEKIEMKQENLASLEKLKQNELNASNEKRMEQIQHKVESCEENINELGNCLQNHMERLMNSNPSNQIDKMLKQLEHDLDGTSQSFLEIPELEKTWGLDQADLRISGRERKELVTELQSSKNFKKIAELIGRMQLLSDKSKSEKNKSETGSIKSVTRGNQLENSLPSERMKLAHPTMKKDFYQRYMTKNLLQYEKNQKKPKGKGPIICCIDVSSSMEGFNEEWCKAMSVVLSQRAKKENRNFVGILFNTDVQRVLQFKKGQVRPTELIDFIRYGSCGGTSFEAPLEEALKYIKEEGFEKADIIFITDGDATVSMPFLRKLEQEKKALKFKLIGVSISLGSISSTLRTICDPVFNLTDLNNEKTLTHIFDSLNE